MSEPLRRERVVALIMVMTATTAERARRIDEGATPELDHGAFVANLIDMCSALVLVSEQLSPAVGGPCGSPG